MKNRYKGKRNLIILLFCILVMWNVKSSFAQNSDTKSINSQLWIDIYPTFYLNEHIQYYGDAGFRTIIGEKSWNRIYVRPSIRYHLNKTIEFHGGLGLFYIFDKYNLNRFEITPWQGVQLNWPSSKRIKVSHLTKIEERLSFVTDNWSSSFNLRLRYKLSGNLNFLQNGSMKKWYIPAYIEFFFPVDDEIQEFFSNRSRTGLGIGHKFNEDWNLALMYNWQRSKAGVGDKSTVSDHIIQLKIKKRWSSKK